MPPGFTHCKSAVPPEVVRNAPVTILASPAALKWDVKLKSEFFVIVGVPIKCGLACPNGAANTLDGAIRVNTRIAVPTNRLAFALSLLSCFSVKLNTYR